MRTQWTGVDESIEAKMCWKLVDDNSGKITCGSIICSVIESGTANLQVHLIKPLPDGAILDTEEDVMFWWIYVIGRLSNTIFSHTQKEKWPVDSVPISTKSKTWQDIVRQEQDKHY